jgi:hypothetical protein
MRHLLYPLAMFCAAFGGAMINKLPYLSAALWVVGIVCLWAAIKDKT